jgi:hypothetical protein
MVKLRGVKIMSNNKDNVVMFPRTVDMILRDIERICDETIDIKERSESLLRWSKEMVYPSNDN